MVAEEFAHFLRRFEVVAAAGKREAGTAVVVAGLQQRGAGLDGEQGLVGLGIVLVRVVEVVGGHEREVQVLGQAQEITRHAPFDVEPVVHEFAEVVFGAEDVAEFRGSLKGFAVLSQPQPCLDFAGRATGGGDQAFRIGVQQLPVQPGPFAEDCIQGCDGGSPEQVAHPHVVVTEQGHVGIRTTAGDVVLALAFLAPPHTGLVATCGPGSDVGFDADDWLDALVGGPLPKVEGTEKIAMVCRGEGRHAEPLGFVEQLTEPGGAVQHGVFGVVVEVHERVVAGSHRTILVPVGARRVLSTCGRR